jgi:hypothetical protein
LPDPGRKLVVQWHHVNTTGTPQDDASVVQVCTRPASDVADVASATLLGGEKLEIPPNSTQDVVSTCLNETDDPIEVFMLHPLMRELGIHVLAELQRVGRTRWVRFFDEPFDPSAHVHYTFRMPAVLQPGDTLRSTCRFRSTSFGTVGYGQSRWMETCSLIAYASPANALPNGVLSLVGAMNTCWQFGQ